MTKWTRRSPSTGERQAPSPVVRSLFTIHVYELETGEVWGEVIADSSQVSELTEDSVPELLDGFAEILEGVTFADT